MRDGEGGGRPASQRIAHERGFLDAQLLVEDVEEFDQHRNAVVHDRLVRFAEADLVGDVDMVLAAEGGDRHRPIGCVAAEAVQQDYRGVRRRAGFEVVDLLAEDFHLLRFGRRRLRLGGDKDEGRQNETLQIPRYSPPGSSWPRAVRDYVSEGMYHSAPVCRTPQRTT